MLPIISAESLLRYYSVSNVIRVVAFFYIRAIVLLTEVVAPPFGSFLMEKYSPWTPIWLALPALASGFFFILVMPPLPIVRDTKSVGDEAESLEDVEEPAEEPPVPTLSRVSTHVKSGAHAFINGLVREAYQTITETGQVVFSNRVVACSVAAYMVSQFGRETVGFLPQYTSKRLGWSFAKTSYLVSLRAFVNMILFLLVLPALTRYFSRVLHFQPARTDLWITRWSIVPLLAGSLLLGFAGNGAAISMSLALYTLGLGLPSAVQSFATAYVSPAQVSILYVALGMSNTLASLIAAPLLASSFSLGLKLGGAWIGLPFWVSALLYVAVGVCVWGVLRMRNRSVEEETGGGE